MDRELSVIAAEIRKDWRPVHYTAVPYLSAMSSLSKMSDSYHADSADGVVAYFLSNAGQWKGDVARRVKKELRAMLATFYKNN